MPCVSTAPIGKAEAFSLLAQKTPKRASYEAELLLSLTTERMQCYNTSFATPCHAFLSYGRPRLNSALSLFSLAQTPRLPFPARRSISRAVKPVPRLLQRRGALMATMRLRPGPPAPMDSNGSKRRARGMACKACRVNKAGCEGNFPCDR